MLTRGLVFGVAAEEPVLMLIHLAILVTIVVVGTIADRPADRAPAGARMTAHR